LANKARDFSADKCAVVGNITIEVPAISITASIPVSEVAVSVEAHMPSVSEILKNKNLWRIVVYCSLLEFYAKIRLRVFFEAHGIKNSKWLDNLSILPLDRVRQMLRDLALIDKRTDKKILRVQQVRNNVIHNILVSAMLSLPEEAEEVAEKAQQCILVLTKSKIRRTTAQSDKRSDQCFANCKEVWGGG